MQEQFSQIATWIVVGIEALGVAAIVIGVVTATASLLPGLFRREPFRELYQLYRRRLGRAILLGLELLVAADIINTVTIDTSLHNVAVLGIVVLVRTFLSFAIEIEITGRWPWAGDAAAPDSARRQSHG